MAFLFVHIVIPGMADIDFHGTNDIRNTIEIGYF